MDPSKSEDLMNAPETMTDEEVTAMLADMGLKRLEEDHHPIWQRWKCRVFGPHAWVPVRRLIPSTGALIEEGAICDLCHKEVTK